MKALVRSLSKLYYIPLVVDIIIGFAMGANGERKRALDRFVKTTVVKIE